MKTSFTTSFGQMEGYRGSFAAPIALRVARGYRGSPPAGLRYPHRSASTGYRSLPAVASDGEPGYSQFARCLLLFSLLLVARVVAGLPPVAAGSPALATPAEYLARHEDTQAIGATTILWELSAAPGLYTAGPDYISARDGPLPPVAATGTY